MKNKEILNMDALNEVRAVMEEGFASYITAWLINAREHLDSIQKAVNENDWEKIFAFAHNLKSSSAMIGALSVSKAALNIELKAREALDKGMKNQAKTITPLLSVCIDAVNEADHALIQELECTAATNE